MDYSSTTQISSAFANYGAKITKVSEALQYGKESIVDTKKNSGSYNTNNKNVSLLQNATAKGYKQITKNANEGTAALLKVRSAYNTLEGYSARLYNIGKLLVTDAFLTTNEEGVLNGKVAKISSDIDEVVSNTKLNGNPLIGTSSKTFTIGVFLDSPQYSMTIGPISSVSSKTLDSEALATSISLDAELTQLKAQIDSNLFPIEQIKIVSDVAYNTNFTKYSYKQNDDSADYVLQNKSNLSKESSNYLVNNIDYEMNSKNIENIKKINTKA